MSTYAYVRLLTYAMTPSKIVPMASTSDNLPWYLLRSDLREFYGLSRGGIDNYQRRGLLPPPDATCSTGLLWAQQTLRDAREQPIATLAAAVPIDDDLGRDDLDQRHVYMCPARSGHFIGWTSPSIIGLVKSGNVAQWHRVRECARYDGPGAYETSTAAPSVQAHLDAARRRRDHPDLTVYLLEKQPLAVGHIRVSATSKTAGLQRGRLLVRDGNRVGARGAWLDLPHTRSTAELSEYTLPILDDAFPLPQP